jgi:glycosyltransferase involved in cell wall biosynthesis
MTATSVEQKILYVCPLAHHGGHRPSAVLTETSALISAGFDVTLLTFSGFSGDANYLQTKHLTVLSKSKFSAFISYFVTILSIRPKTKEIIVLFEQFLTLIKAVYLRRKIKYDIIHLSDGDPFVFLVLSINFFLKNYRWIIHVFFDPRKGLGKIDYAKFWRPIYNRSLRRNNFVFLCENEEITKEYKKILDGLLDKKTIYFPLATQFVGNTLSKEDARCRLGLPANKTLLLCFGSLHSGKNLTVVASATRDLPNTYVVFAGKAPSNLIQQLRSINKNIIVRDCYISEEEKPLYYSAADAVIISYNKSFLEKRSGAMLWDACKFASTVIASDGGQIGTLVKNFKVGLTFETENTLSLRNAVIQCQRLNQQDIQSIRANCRKFCNNFSTENWGKRYATVCNNFFKS